MIHLLALLAPVWLASTASAASAGEDALVIAAEAELQRAMDIRLPGQPPPYFVSYEFLDGHVVTSSAQSGVLVSHDVAPFRNVRVEVRVGSYELDNSRFQGGFGEREGLTGKGLPDDNNPLAIQRELWLATDFAYKGAAEQYSSKLASREGQPPPTAPVASFEARPPLVTAPIAVAPIPDAPTLERVRVLSEAIGDLPGIENAEAASRDWVGRRLLVSSEGTRAYLPTGFSVVRVEAITRTAEGDRLRDCRWWVASTPEGLPPLDEMVAEVKEMAAYLEAAATAPREADYLGPVLFEGPAAAELFRQLLMPEVVGTPPAEAAPDPYSPAAAPASPRARIGRRLLPEGWSVVDNPRQDAHIPGAYTYDFEGVEAKSVQLIEDGVLKDVLMSRIPRADRPHSTGHGRGLATDTREAMPAVVTVRAPRSASPAKLQKRALTLARQADLPYVLVVKRIEPPALSEDFEIAFTGDGPLSGLTRPLEVVRLYRDGHEELVQPGLSFVGVDRRVLRDIAAAGATEDPVGVLDAPPGGRRYSIGAVGGLPASWSVPAVVVTELELRYSGNPQPRMIPPPVQ